MKKLSILISLAYMSLQNSTAYAGMPSFTLTDIARFRFSTISFFLMIYIAASFIILRLWNFLRKDFHHLPKLSFFKALVFVFLWGLAFHLILVMIAGTRELMTPEAWEKAGVIHKLSPDTFQQSIDTRRHKLEVLKQGLWRFAESHAGQFPHEQERSSLPEEAWLAPAGDLKYRYVDGLAIKSLPIPLAYEPDTYGQERMALLTNGQIELLPVDAIESLIKEKK